MTSKLPWDAYQTSTGTALADVIICECYNWNRICWTGNDWKKTSGKLCKILKNLELILQG